jgi:hypothetical protein
VNRKPVQAPNVLRACPAVARQVADIFNLAQAGVGTPERDKAACISVLEELRPSPDDGGRVRGSVRGNSGSEVQADAISLINKAWVKVHRRAFKAVIRPKHPEEKAVAYHLELQALLESVQLAVVEIRLFELAREDHLGPAARVLLVEGRQREKDRSLLLPLLCLLALILDAN